MGSWARALALSALALGASSCKSGLFKFQGTITTTKTVNGKTETKTQEFDDWDEMRKAMDESRQQMRATTKELVQKLVEVPPPGEVKLADLSPSLADYDGNEEFDFIAKARAEGDADSFMYVQIGVPSYDDFFRAAAEFHGFVYQTRESISHLRRLLRAQLEGEYSAKLTLGDAVRLAIGGDAELGEEGEDGPPPQLVQMRDLTVQIAGAAPEFLQRTQQLVATGQQLVTAAPSSIVNPKTVTHLDLIVKGVGQSATVVGESGKLLGEMTKELTTL